MKAFFTLLILPLFLNLALSQASSTTMTAHFIDINQADATLLEFECAAVLIDAGAQGSNTNESRQKLMDYLDDFFQRRSDLNDTIEVIIITHNHSDHIKSLDVIREKYHIKNIVSSRHNLKTKDMVYKTKLEEEGIKYDWVEYTDVLAYYPLGYYNNIVDPVKCGNADPWITLFSGGLEDNPGWSKSNFKNPNNHSLVVRVKFGQSSFIFTGDLEKEGIELLLHNYKNDLDLFDVDVYQVGHHGSKNATTAELLDAISPDIAVISASNSSIHKGKTGFAYGHPNKGVVDSLSVHISGDRLPINGDVFETAWHGFPKKNDSMQSIAIDKKIYCTCWDGTVKITAHLDGTLEVIE